jgi:hypothetical protein
MVSETATPSRRANKVADWIEITCLRRASAVGSDMLQGLGEPLGYAAVDISLGLRTMSRRLALLGDAYPFRVASGAAALPTAGERAWTALLLMSSNSPLRQSIDVGAAAVFLEQVTAEALLELYGPGTQSVRFAWPSEDGRPSGFPDGVRWLADRMQIRMGSAYRSPYAKDGGVDVVAWRPFPDGRSGFPVLLVQCTLERDYRHKAADVDIRVWAGWLALDVDPATALAIPEVVAAGEEWNALAARTVVLDRIRLAALLQAREGEHARLLGVIAWAQATITQLQGLAD